MLNLKELEKQFDEILASLTTQDVEEWLVFAEQRELEDKLKKGATVALKCETYKIVNIEDNSIKAIIFDKNLVNYAESVAA